MTIRYYSVFIVMYCCVVTLPLLSEIDYTGKETVVVTGGFESVNSFIRYLTINGKRYILKQKKDASRLMTAIREALAAYIAQDLHIAHSVKIIAIEDDISGKVNVQSPATLHTIAAGKSVRSQPESRYSQLCLKQRSPEDLLLGRWLTEEIIDQITWHKQLPLIIALDLFISNTDRHGDNLFYDPVTDRFCAIDMDNIFRRDLPELARKKLIIMVKIQKKKFTKEEIVALTSVRNTLQFLSRRHSPNDIIAKLHFFAQQISNKKNSVIHSKVMIKKIKSHEKMIIKSHKSLYRLIGVLNEIIMSSTKQ